MKRLLQLTTLLLMATALGQTAYALVSGEINLTAPRAGDSPGG